MIGRLIIAIAALAAASSFAHAAKPETLTVMRECPFKGWHRACLPIGFFFEDDNSGRLETREVPTERHSWPEQWLDNILVEGSLIEETGRGAFRLKLDTQIDESDMVHPHDLGAFAFVGRSRTGHPIVLTNRGPLEITTKAIRFSSYGDLFIVQERTGKLIARAVHTYSMPFVVTKAGEIGLWDATRAICVSAPNEHTRDLAIVTTACKTAGLPKEGNAVGGAVVQVSDYDEGMVSAIALDPTEKEVYRVPGTGLLLIWARWYSCC